MAHLPARKYSIRNMPQSKEVKAISEHLRKPTDVEIVNMLRNKGFVDYAQVGCSITDTISDLWKEMARREEINLTTTTHEHNLPPIAAGIYFGTGRPALIHMQNSGLPNAGDGIISLASVYKIPMLVLVTWRGSNERDDSEPHQAIGTKTSKLTRDIIGNKHVYGNQDGKGFIKAIEKAVDAVNNGEVAMVRLSPDAFQKKHELSLPNEGEIFSQKEYLKQLGMMQKLAKTKGALSSPIPTNVKLSRDEALIAIVANHPDAAVIFSNGYTARAAQEVVDRHGNFYSTGNMGGALAMGWALARSNPDIEVVVVDGDQNAQMSTMKDNLKAEYPENLYWYILNNGIGASVGTIPSVPLSLDYYQLARVIPTMPDALGSFKYPRVNARGVYFESKKAKKMAEQQGTLPAHAQMFRQWIQEKTARNLKKRKSISSLHPLLIGA